MSGIRKGGKGGKGRVLRVTLEEMHEGMELEGIIRSVKPYGAFVDVGSTTDGLLHISQMLPAHRQYVGNEMVVTASEGEQVLVEVVSVDLRARKFAVREVQLSWKVPEKKRKGGGGAGAKGGLGLEEAESLFGEVLTGDEADPAELEANARRARKHKQAVEKWAGRMRNRGFFGQPKPATVTSVTEYGAFVDLGGPAEGLLHVSEMEGRGVVSRGGKILLKPGDPVHVRIVEVDVETQRVRLTQKAGESESAEAEESAAAMAVLEERRGEEEGKGGEGGGAGGRNAFAKAWERALARDSDQRAPGQDSDPA